MLLRYAGALTRAPALFWVTGALLAGQSAAATVTRPWWWMIVAAAALGVVLATRRLPIRLAAMTASLLAALFGYWQVEQLQRSNLAPQHIEHLAGARVVLRGRVAERPASRPDKLRLVIDTQAVRRGPEWEPAHGRVLVTLRSVSQAWQRGGGVEAIVALRRPRNFGNPGEFDFEAYLARRGIYATAFAADDRSWLRLPAPPTWTAAIERWRDAVATTIAATLPEPTASITAALLVGDVIALPLDVRDRFARAGVSHVLSISGLHVGLVAGAAYALLRWLLARSERALLRANVPKLAMAASLAPLAVYAAIAGDNVATIRSEIMGVLVVSAVLLDRPRDWLAPLAAAARDLPLRTRLHTRSASSSFAAVLAIVSAMPRVIAWWNAWEEAHLVRLRGRHWQWLRWVVLTEAVTVCATLGTAPLAAWHFNQVSLIALVANPLVVPLLGMACVGLGLVATVAVAVAPAAAPPLFHIVGAIVAAADALVRLCAALPYASVPVVTPSPLELVLLYAGLAALLIREHTLRRWVLGWCLIGLVCDAAYWKAPLGALQITFLSVGQGDCAVVEFPGRAVMVVDGGGLSGDFDVGRQVVAPFLWRRKIAHVDVLALSHADFDHFGGLTLLAQAFAPTAFLERSTGARARGSAAGKEPQYAHADQSGRQRVLARHRGRRGARHASSSRRARQRQRSLARPATALRRNRRPAARRSRERGGTRAGRSKRHGRAQHRAEGSASRQPHIEHRAAARCRCAARRRHFRRHRQSLRLPASRRRRRVPPSRHHAAAHRSRWGRDAAHQCVGRDLVRHRTGRGAHLWP
jgi:competence protein ComEC